MKLSIGIAVARTAPPSRARGGDPARDLVANQGGRRIDFIGLASA